MSSTDKQTLLIHSHLILVGVFFYVLLLYYVFYIIHVSMFSPLLPQKFPMSQRKNSNETNQQKKQPESVHDIWYPHFSPKRREMCFITQSLESRLVLAFNQSSTIFYHCFHYLIAATVCIGLFIYLLCAVSIHRNLPMFL